MPAPKLSRKNFPPTDFPGAYWIGQEEIDLVTAVLRARSPFRYYGIDMQNMVEQFEAEFATHCGTKYALGVNSGTSALMASMAALGVGPGCEVIVPGYMWIATVSAVVRMGAIPVLAEIDETFTMDPTDLAAKITDKTRAIIVVHMCGAPANMPAIVDICRSRGVAIVEDCAQANGATLNGKHVGSFGDIGIFSLQANKNMTAGEGGVFVTSTESLYRRALAFHDLGFTRNDEGKLVQDPSSPAIMWGNGSRMSELTGAVALAQLRKLPKMVGAMRTVKQKIKSQISQIPGIKFRKILDAAGDSSPALITIYESPAKARQVAEKLAGLGVRCNVSINCALHLYSNMLNLVEKRSISADGFPWTHPDNRALVREYKKGVLPRTDSLLERSVSLAVPGSWTDADVSKIVNGFHVALGEPVEADAAR